MAPSSTLFLSQAFVTEFVDGVSFRNQSSDGCIINYDPLAFARDVEWKLYCHSSIREEDKTQIISKNYLCSGSNRVLFQESKENFLNVHSLDLH